MSPRCRKLAELSFMVWFSPASTSHIIFAIRGRVVVNWSIPFDFHIKRHDWKTDRMIVISTSTHRQAGSLIKHKSMTTKFIRSDWRP